MNIQEKFSAATGNAVKFLSSQISLFGGTEEEDVELWIEKIENVSSLHGLTPVASATSKLTKMARKWFDMSTGTVNKSWLTFKKEIVDRFKRKILFSDIMLKVDARKWIYSKESFQEYSMVKIALMKSLKLSDEDSIQLLIKGIGSFTLRTTAAALKVDSLNQFLREMQHITAATGDIAKKSPTMKHKYEKKDSNNKDTNIQEDRNVKMINLPNPAKKHFVPIVIGRTIQKKIVSN